MRYCLNKEVGQEAALYWNKRNGSLSKLVEKADVMNPQIIEKYSLRAKERIKNAFSWKYIGDRYASVWAGEK